VRDNYIGKKTPIVVRETAITYVVMLERETALVLREASILVKKTALVVRVSYIVVL
jgi:hypothetical protein